ncbi:hemicentin-2-like isoform X1 [Penaeus indicus]|uniref:hemicentin-2-like isoform X1 n=1 Tax=Penaeus indicus TaxID=29960 RepID=UPI00300CC35E
MIPVPAAASLSLSVIASTAVIISSVCLANADAPNPNVFRGAPPIQYSTLSGPSFLNSTDNSIQVVAGTTAMLTCGIKNLHNYTVSWVRGRDIRLLTTGSITYTSDTRFVPFNPSGGQQWILKIHYVRLTDAGSYLCQVSTTPPITHAINLTVHPEAVAKILPAPEVHVQLGSRLEVTCQVEGCPPPALLSWTREGQPVLTPDSSNYDLANGNATTPIATLTLARPHAEARDSGSYSCSSKCTTPVNVTVHVLREELAAMQHHNAASRKVASADLLSSVLLAMALLAWWRWQQGGHNTGSVECQLDLVLPADLTVT